MDKKNEKKSEPKDAARPFVTPRPSLAYEGQSIRDDDELLCLTDMWKAHGADPSKRPVDWLKRDAAQEFVEYIASEKKVQQVHLFKNTAGRNGATWAHWQIAFAYAKWLSPSFHAWCNEAARDRMQGRTVIKDRIRLYLVDSPTEYRKLWEDEVVESLAHLYRNERDRSKGFPVWLCGIAGKLYDRIWTSEVANKVREKEPHKKGIKYFQHLSEPARQMTLAELGFIRSMAETSMSPDEFWARVNQRYLGDPFQLSFTGEIVKRVRDES